VLPAPDTVVAVTRASRTLIDWAVGARGTRRVEWAASSAVRRSVAVAERLGMTREGVLREAYPYRGKCHDEEIWAVLAPDWRKGRG
jgi:ribosomal-protein-serine acetyltransferase